MFKKITDFSDSKNGLYFVLLFSLLVKILTLVIMSDMAINRDGTQYIAAARQFAQGDFREGFAFHSMPFYSLIIAAVHFAVRNWLVSARLISSLSLVLAIIPLYLMTREFFNRKAAFWAALAFSLSPEPNQLSMEVLRDPVYILVLLWAVYFAQRAIREKELGFFLAAAVFSFIPFLFRIEGIIFPPYYSLFLAGFVFISIFKASEKGYLKGFFVWSACLLLLAGAVWAAVGPELGSFNKMDNVAEEIQKITGFQVGENYRALYERLETLEEMSFYPSGNQNFAEVARHYMPLIYLIGLLELFIKNIFIIFLIPFISGLRHSLSRARFFVLSFIVFYLLFIFYTYVERDFIQTRFLLAPAILLYPWVGLGLDRIWSKVVRSPRSILLFSIFAVVFIFMPLGRYVDALSGEGGAIYRAGEWLRGNSQFQVMRFYANDSRIAFHADRPRDEFEKTATRFKKENKKKGVTLEAFALKNRIDVVVVEFSKKDADEAPEFSTYKKIKEFKSKKRIVRIYCLPGSCQRLDSGHGPSGRAP